MIHWLAALALVAQDPGVRVRTYPERPLIERDAHQQYLNFDFGFENDGDEPRELERIELSVFDRSGRLAFRQFIWSKGAVAPGFLTTPDRTIPAKGKLGLFNPFYALPPDLSLDRLHFEFQFGLQGLEPAATLGLDVRPLRFQSKTRLTLPLDGPALVYDGHDYYSHHRRIPLGSPRAAGFATNPVRYANDWSVVGPAGELARGPQSEPTNWYAYGATVRAPAAGQVVSAFNDVPDNRIERGDLVVAPGARDAARASLGNSVIIKHADGEYSLLAHLKAGSVRVKAGDRVRAGDSIGQIGFSGDTGLHVHLHHMLSTGAGLDGEGLPAYFDRVRRVTLPRSGSGGRGPPLMGVRADTGDLLEAVR